MLPIEKKLKIFRLFSNTNVKCMKGGLYERERNH